MTHYHREPPRLLADKHADPVVRRLLRSGLQDGPPRNALRAAPAAVAALLSSKAAGAGTAVSAAATGGAAYGSTAASASAVGVGAAGTKLGATITALGIAKWVGIGVLAGAVSSGAALQLSRIQGAKEPLSATSALQTTMPSRPPAPSRGPAVAAPQSGLHVPHAAQAELPPARPGRTPELKAPATPRADLSREVSLLDTAKAALSASNPAAAMTHLDRLERLPRRALAPEATALRVSALLALGEEREARAVVDRFTRSAPKSPLASVLRGLVDPTQENVIQNHAVDLY